MTNNKLHYDEKFDALYKLENFRDVLKWRAFEMASIDYIRTSPIQDLLRQELSDRYDDSETCIRSIVHKAFGEYPFERFDWEVFGDWEDSYIETEKVDFIIEKLGQEPLYDDWFDVDAVGYPEWCKHCIQKAKDWLINTIKQIDKFLEKHNYPILENNEY